MNTEVFFAKLGALNASVHRIISEREAMILENKVRESAGEAPAYTSDDLFHLASQLNDACGEFDTLSRIISRQKA